MNVTNSPAEPFLTDIEIIDLYFLRDESAIMRTDDKYGKYLLSLALNIVHDKNDGEECLNDTYMDAWNSMPPQRPNVLKAFLSVIMRRTAVDLYRKKTRRQRIASEYAVSFDELDDYFVSTDDTYSKAEVEELSRSISNFLRNVNERKKYIFIGRYFYSKPIKELAETLSCSVSTVNKDLASLRKELKAALEREGYIL